MTSLHLWQKTNIENTLWLTINGTFLIVSKRANIFLRKELKISKGGEFKQLVVLEMLVSIATSVIFFV